jgi:hypothetical protein
MIFSQQLAVQPAAQPASFCSHFRRQLRSLSTAHSFAERSTTSRAARRAVGVSSFSRIAYFIFNMFEIGSSSVQSDLHI